MNNFWRTCLNQFEKELPPQQYITWIKPLTVTTTDDADDASAMAVTVIAPNRFVLQWIRDKFFKRINELALAHFGRSVPIQLLLAEKETATQAFTSPAAIAAVDAPTGPHHASNPIAPALSNRPPVLPRDLARLNPAFTFDISSQPISVNASDTLCPSLSCT